MVWGSDYPVAMLRGKAISLADGFYWIDAEDARRFSQKAPVRVNLIAIENLLAVRQACALLDLSGEQVKKLFYENALRLLRECCPALKRRREIMDNASRWHGYRRLDFPFEGKTATLVFPEKPAPGLPWAEYTEYFGAFPDTALALLARGIPFGRR